MIAADGTAVYPWNHGETLTAAALNSAIAQGGLGGGPLTGPISTPHTGHIYAENGAVIDRLADRLFVGNAVLNDGSQAFATRDTTILGGSGGEYFNAEAQFASYSDVGGIGGAFATRTSNYGETTAYKAAIGVASYVINDNATTPIGSWGVYSSVVRNAGAATTIGMELDVANKGTLSPAIPYNIPTNLSLGLHLGCGGETSQLAGHGPVNPASAALTIVTTDPNANAVAGTGGVWNRGIVFQASGISGTNGHTGSGVAVSMALGHAVQWDFDGSGQPAGLITANTNMTGLGGSVVFSNGAVNIGNTAMTSGYVFNVAGTIDNYINFNIGTGTTGPLIRSASATNTDVDLRVYSQGAGAIRLGTNINTTQMTVTTAGVTITPGALTVGSNGQNGASQTMNAASGTARTTLYQSAGLTDWAVGEGGTQAFVINRYNPSGTFADQCLSIAQNTGIATFADGVAITAGTVQATALGGMTLGASGPTIRAGTGAATGTQPAGSLWLRTDGAAGSRIYVSAGGGTWAAIAGV